MRWLAVALLAVGCDAPPASAPSPGALELRASLGAAAPAAAGVSISTVRLHLTGLAAVSDLGVPPGRAHVDALDLMPGATETAPLPSAPPGLYAGLALAFGDAQSDGIALEGAHDGVRLHVAISAAPFTVVCAAPQPLEPGRNVRLTLTADMSGWLDGVDLSTASGDADDAGILISFEDNAPLAAQVLRNAMNLIHLDCASW
jgi:hypothetical protein